LRESAVLHFALHFFAAVKTVAFFGPLQNCTSAKKAQSAAGQYSAKFGYTDEMPVIQTL
jgi:hypothetical protein